MTSRGMRCLASADRIRLVRYRVDIPPVAIVRLVDQLLRVVPRVLADKLLARTGVTVIEDPTAAARVGPLIRRDDKVIVFRRNAVNGEVVAAILFPYMEKRGAGEELVGLVNAGVCG
jgi:hypothetical protein